MKGRDPSHRDMLARILLILLNRAYNAIKLLLIQSVWLHVLIYIMGIAVQDNENLLIMCHQPKIKLSFRKSACVSGQWLIGDSPSIC